MTALSAFPICEALSSHLASAMRLLDFPVLGLPFLLMLAFSACGADAPAIDPKNMDTTTQPRVDFYQYANGGWVKEHPIPGEYSQWGSFQELFERNLALLHEILEEAAASVKKGEVSNDKIRQLVGQFYLSGMNEEQVNAEGAKPLQPELDAIQKISDAKGVATALGHLHALGVDALFGITGDLDEKDTKNQIAQLGQGGLGLPDRDYYLKDDERFKKLRDQYVEHISKIFQLLGDPAPAAAEKAKQILRFETELAKASKSPTELRDPESNYHKLAFADIQKLATDLDWPAYLDGLGLSQEQMAQTDVGQPDFVKRAGELIASTPIDTWKAYFEWHLIHSIARYLSAPFVDEDFAFYQQALQGTKENQPRWKRVLREIDQSVGEALGQLYVEKHFPPEAKQRALAMINDLKSALRDRIQTLEWMGPQTRAAALKKLDAFGVKIGYPDKWRDYSALEIKDQPYVLNVLAAQTFELKHRLGRIGEPVDKTEWGMSPPTVNAYYSPRRNEIVFPAGILQPPFFDANADDAVNYGGIGAVIGHEMTHGFDDQGRKYDPQGNMKNWWTAADEKRFQERSKKIVEQFNSYVAMDDLHINGELTEGENIADLGGVKLAYAALEKALQRKPAAERTQKIDGFTPEQRFFLSWAQVWRNNTRPEAKRLRLQVDPHSPGQFRVNGPLSNLPEFARAFQIPDKSPMVRPAKDRVQIW
jgi:putative endopeptidase